MINLQKAEKIVSTNAKKVVEILYREGGEVMMIIEQHKLGQNNDLGALESIVDQVISTHPQQVAEIQSGNIKILGFLVGQCMKASQGSGNPKIFNDLISTKLGI